jgi:hypothetical protein
MRSYPLFSALFAGLFVIATASAVGAQTDTQDPDAHHPEQTQAAPQSDGTGEAPAAGMHKMMDGMMTPEMMQMMQRMMSQGGMPGMMERHQMPMAGAMAMCPMMSMMDGGADPDRHAMAGGAGLLYGMPHGGQEEMTPERVRLFIEQHLTWHGNPRLKIGEITSTEGGITAEIVTLDGSLVQKLAFNRYPGLFRQIP